MARQSDYFSDLFKDFFNVSFLAVYHCAVTLQVIHGLSYILGLIHHVIFNLPSASHLSFERIVQGWNRK